MVDLSSFIQDRHKKISSTLSKGMISVLPKLFLGMVLLITTIFYSDDEKTVDLSSINKDSNRSLEERNLKDTVDLEMVILSISIVLIVCFLVKSLLEWLNIRWLPESCAYILVGSSISLMNELSKSEHDMVMERFYFDEQFFLQILLPAILFDAALSIDKMSFRRDLFPILLFAFVGTAFSTVAIGYMTYWITDGLLPLLESLVFGALISSIDPVATLGTLSGLGISQTGTLYTLIFGESLLNDGVAIVLFDTLKMHLGDESALDDIATYRMMAFEFVYVLIGSVFIAVCCGASATFFYWLLQRRQDAVVEVAAFFCWALIPYYVAEFLNCSGVMAILVMGFIMDYYILGDDRNSNSIVQDFAEEEEVSNNITPLEAWNGKGLLEKEELRNQIRIVSHTLATTMETLLFAYLGLFLFESKTWNIKLNMVAVLSCIVSRVVMVIVLASLVNYAVKCDLERKVGSCFRQKSFDNRTTPAPPNQNQNLLLDQRTQMILFLAGIRGAVSFALVRNIPGSSRHKTQLKAMTSTCIIFTLFVFGVLTYFFLQRDNRNDENDDTLLQRNHYTEEAIPLRKKNNTKTTNHTTQEGVIYGATPTSV